jgi:hypothetical protein
MFVGGVDRLRWLCKQYLNIEVSMLGNHPNKRNLRAGDIHIGYTMKYHE